MEVILNSAVHWQGGAEISLYYHVYNSGFLAPYSVTKIDKVELNVKRLFIVFVSPTTPPT